MSANRSLQTRNCFDLFFHSASDGALPFVVKIAYRPPEIMPAHLYAQLAAANVSNLAGRDAVRAQQRKGLVRIGRGDGYDDARLRFVEQRYAGLHQRWFRCCGVRAHPQLHAGPEQLFRVKATLRQRDGQAAFAAIVRAFHQAFANQIAHGVLHADFVRQIDFRRRTEL